MKRNKSTFDYFWTASPSPPSGSVQVISHDGGGENRPTLLDASGRPMSPQPKPKHLGFLAFSDAESWKVI